MASRPTVVFVVPGDLNSLTGGYGYDRRIIAGLRRAGWQVEVLSLGMACPWPSVQERSQADGLIDAIPDGTLVVIDGLAFGCLPDLAERHARRLRWVALVHHPLAHETGLSAAQQAQLWSSEQRALATARAVIVTSHHTARGLGDFGVPRERISVVEPGTDPAPLSRGGGPQGLSFLCVATLTPRKGHQCLVEALAGLKQRAWTLHCVGSLLCNPATANSVRAALEARGLQNRVQLHGEVSPGALAALYDQAGVFVLPSFFEGYGMALAEALAHGLPVCSTTAGAIPDTVPADAGVLVPAGDVAALRAALARLIDEPDWRATLAQGAARARERLPSWALAVARFADQLEVTPP